MHEQKSEKKENSAIEEIFDLSTFKTQKCLNSFKHDKKTCIFYHVKDKRRNPKNFSYINEHCKGCQENNKCKKCHSQYEFLYHVDNYKKKLCMYDGKCVTPHCSFFHTGRNDRIWEEKEEEKKIFEKCSSLDSILIEKQEISMGLGVLMCSVCDKLKITSVLGCGHGKCGECKLMDACVICGKPSKPVIEINLSKKKKDI